MKINIKLSTLLLPLMMVFHQSSAMSAQEAISQANASAGTITAINFENNSIQIDQTNYPLSDNLTTLSPDNATISKILLSPGQKIQYWLQSAGKESQILKIKITSNFNSEMYKR